MTTRDQVADLREGDVVEAVHRDWSEGSKICGPIQDVHGLRVCGYSVAFLTGPAWTLTVVSRAPRPLYVNHPTRTEPVPGDAARNADDEQDRTVWLHTGDGFWGTTRGHRGFTWAGDHSGLELPARFRLLVDGETGQVVPS